MEELLTRDAEKLLGLIYKRYLEVRKSGSSRHQAKQLGSSAKLLQDLKLNSSLEDLDDYCRELDRNGYLHVRYAANTVFHATLADAGIAKLERRFTDGLKSVIEFLTRFA